MMKKSILLWMGLSVFYFAGGQIPLPKIEMQLSKDSIFIGDTVTLKIFLEHDKRLTGELPILRDSVMQGIEILEVSALDTVNDRSIPPHNMKVVRNYLLTSFTGNTVYSFPSIQFLVNSGHRIDTVRSNILKLVVKNPTLDSTFTPHPIMPIIEYPYTLDEFLPYILLGILILLLIVFGVWLFFRLNGKKNIFARKEPEIPPYEKAIKALQGLKSRKLWESGRDKEYYSLLSDIVRRYIEGRFQIPSMEQTSNEIITSFQRIEGIEKELVEKLKECFYFSDLAKFAKYTPLPNENEQSFLSIVEFVEKTKPVDDEVKPSSEQTH